MKKHGSNITAGRGMLHKEVKPSEHKPTTGADQATPTDKLAPAPHSLAVARLEGCGSKATTYSTVLMIDFRAIRGGFGLTKKISYLFP